MVNEHGIDRSAASTAPLRVLLVEDFHRHDDSWVHPGLHALWVYRFGHWGLDRPRPLRVLVKVLHRLVNRLVVQNLYGTEVCDEAFIGRRVRLGHHQALQIPGFSVIGDESVIRNNVTLGFTGTTSARQDVPRLGRRVEVGVGACLLGPITVGDGAKIGPHAIVTVDVPAGATAFSPPARILRPAPGAMAPVPEATAPGAQAPAAGAEAPAPGAEAPAPGAAAPATEVGVRA